MAHQTLAMTDAGTGGAVRGACPSAHEPFMAADGLLIRIRRPGGAVTAGQVGALAELLESGLARSVELTSRANLQLRGVAPSAHGEVLERLIAADLVLRDAGADAARNVVVSPTAGFDTEEIFDVEPLVNSVTARLVHWAGRLPPKFGVLLDGGGAVNLRGRTHTLALGAVRDRRGSVRFEVAVDGALGAQDSPLLVDVHCVDDVVETVAMCAAERRAPTATVAMIEERLGSCGAERVGAAFIDAPTSTAGVLGVVPSRRADEAAVGAMPRLGRLDAAALHRLADLAQLVEHRDAGVLRVTPWRSVLFCGVARSHAAAMSKDLSDGGFLSDPQDSGAAVIACSGSTGCLSGLVDALGDAHTIIDSLHHQATGPVAVHVSGCAKRCASQSSEMLTLVGSSPNRYDIFLRGREYPTRSGQTMDEALALMMEHVR